MSKSKKSNRSHQRRAKFERLIQLQILDYERRYYPGGRSVAAALWAEKFPAGTNASSSQEPSQQGD